MKRVIKIVDFYGKYDSFEVVSTGKAPAGYERKVSILFLNSLGFEERALVNPNQIVKADKPKKIKGIYINERLVFSFFLSLFIGFSCLAGWFLLIN